MSVRSEALPFVLPFALAASAALAVGLPWIALALALSSAAIAAFFRDPPRRFQGPSNAAVSPADGRVVVVERGSGETLVAVFLALWNVHVARSPVSGVVQFASFYPGGFAPAFRPEASRNARYVMRLARERGDTSSEGIRGDIELSLIAGFVARRVVPWVGTGDPVDRGQRLALVRFGSRAEVRLPGDFEPRVRVGDRVRAGETMIAVPSSTGTSP